MKSSKAKVLIRKAKPILAANKKKIKEGRGFSSCGPELC